MSAIFSAYTDWEKIRSDCASTTTCDPCPAGSEHDTPERGKTAEIGEVPGGTNKHSDIFSCLPFVTQRESGDYANRDDRHSDSNEHALKSAGLGNNWIAKSRNKK